MPLHLVKDHSRAPPGFRGHPRHDHHDSRMGRVEAEVENVHHDPHRRFSPLMILLVPNGRFLSSYLFFYSVRSASLYAILILPST